MDYAKSGDWELGVVIKRHEWVKGMEIEYWSWDGIQQYYSLLIIALVGEFLLVFANASAYTQVTGMTE